jgi:hypothetical protein
MSTYTPTSTTKIKAIRPGEKIILPKSARIIKTIVNNGSVSSSCPTQNLNIIAETKVKYALVIDWVDELGKEDELIGLGLGGQEYLFPGPIPFHQDMKSFGNGTSTSEGGPCGSGTGSCVGISNVFKYMKTLLPGGDVLFTFDKYVWNDDTGSGSTGSDNLFLQAVEFFSYPSVVEGGGFYLIRRNQPGSSDSLSAYYSNSDKQISRVYPIKVDVED